MVHESVAWLATQGEAERCKKILNNIASTNGRQLAPNFFDRFQKIVEENGRDERRAEESGLWHLFKSPGMRKISFLMIIAWVLTSSLYDAHILNVANLNHSVRLTNISIIRTYSNPSSFKRLILLAY